MSKVMELSGDLALYGQLYGMTAVVLPAGTVANSAVSGSAGINASKMEHLHQVTFAQPYATVAEDAQEAVHVVRGTSGTIKSVHIGYAGATDIAGNATVDVDVYVDGATIFSGVPQLTSAASQYDNIAGTIGTASVLQTEVIEVVVNATVGTGALPDGLFCVIRLDEGYT